MRSVVEDRAHFTALGNKVSIDLSERVIVVTGAAGGIGSAVVRALLSDGASVVAADVSQTS